MLTRDYFKKFYIWLLVSLLRKVLRILIVLATFLAIIAFILLAILLGVGSALAAFILAKIIQQVTRFWENRFRLLTIESEYWQHGIEHLKLVRDYFKGLSLGVLVGLSGMFFGAFIVLAILVAIAASIIIILNVALVGVLASFIRTKGIRTVMNFWDRRIKLTACFADYNRYNLIVSRFLGYLFIFRDDIHRKYQPKLKAIILFYFSICKHGLSNKVLMSKKKAINYVQGLKNEGAFRYFFNKFPAEYTHRSAKSKPILNRFDGLTRNELSSNLRRFLAATEINFSKVVHSVSFTSHLSAQKIVLKTRQETVTTLYFLRGVSDYKKFIMALAVAFMAFDITIAVSGQKDIALYIIFDAGAFLIIKVLFNILFNNFSFEARRVLNYLTAIVLAVFLIAVVFFLIKAPRYAQPQSGPNVLPIAFVILATVPVIIFSPSFFTVKKSNKSKNLKRQTKNYFWQRHKTK